MQVKLTIEAGWTYQTWEDLIEIDDEELEDLDEFQREEHIQEVLTDVVNNVVSWGWEEV
jgi:hypothetical protein